MMMNQTLWRVGVRTVACVAMLGVLASCGNTPTRGQGWRVFTEAYKSRQAEGGDRAGGGAAAVPGDKQAAVARTIASVKGPLMVAVLDVNKTTAVLTTIGQNGPYVTWTTADNQSLIFKRGVLTGTRGLGYDLMSSDADAAINLITSRRPGTVQRVYRHIDGLNQEVPTTLSCTITVAGSDTVALSTGASYATTRMKEVCRNDEVKVSNLYWVTSSGAIPQSKQWISQQMGDLAVQVLRN
ncbi:YjbF family lipoprotein [Tropicimonas isoalkanivorans]|uniref:Group 4 capsule polysaccharide lipoprotein gfcB, YjbF n=1 Tax=Tropicimonas isoalkanivorans TaxID=441112 RepID=A0A1I1KZH5_9RHOB|nr:YjbF family lipoprotein [Tropicimonas isoalkanivorans]SFC65692.1 Group 4 capsule polysaccharide lipoprotein gfcB, YjbF [Tropicimonas isoalkanivorans]